MRWKLAALSVLALTVATTSAGQARACEPAPAFSSKIGTEDAPDCMQVRGETGDDGTIGFTNTCDYDITISPGGDCPHCGASIILGAKETTETIYVVETDHSSVNRTVQWQSPQGSGSIAVDVEYTAPDPDACADDGCTASPAGVGGGGSLGAASVLAAICAIAWARRMSRT